MRKWYVFLIMVLAVVLAVSYGSAAENVTKARQGEEITVPVTVVSNPGQGVAALLKLDYDHESLELIPSDFVQNDTILLLNLKGIQPGEAGRVSFRINSEAKRGSQVVRFSVESARNLDEKDVSGPEIETETVIVAKAKEVLGDEYYSNGKIKQKVELNAGGNVQRVLFYNRYGNVTRIEEPEAWDRDGNILRETEYNPNKTGTEQYTYSYTYDGWGNTLSSETTRKEDGTFLGRSDFEYDEYDQRTKTTSYNEKGEIESYIVDYVYDSNNHIIGYRQLDPNGQTVSYTRNVWKNGALIESYSTDPDGNVISRDTYDPVFGDTLLYENTNDNRERYIRQNTYYEDSYEEDRRSYGNGSRTVTLYGTDEKPIKSVSYKAKPNSDNWTEDGYTLYLKNEAGNTVEETHKADGSQRVIERDSNGNSIRILSYQSDGSFDYGYTYEYNSKGQQIRRNRLNEDGTVETYYYSEYDSSGKLSKDMAYKSDKSFYYGFSYEYDSKGQRIRENYLNEDGTIRSYEIIDYNERGNKIRVTDYDGDGRKKSYELTEYNEYGKEIRTTKYDASGTFAGSTEYEYDENGEKTHYATYRKDMTKSYEYYYRILEDGTRQSKSIWYNTDGTVKEENDWE